jgi:hypothetical protein
MTHSLYKHVHNNFWYEFYHVPSYIYFCESIPIKNSSNQYITQMYVILTPLAYLSFQRKIFVHVQLTFKSRKKYPSLNLNFICPKVCWLLLTHANSHFYIKQSMYTLNILSWASKSLHSKIITYKNIFSLGPNH